MKHYSCCGKRHESFFRRRRDGPVDVDRKTAGCVSYRLGDAYFDFDAVDEGCIFRIPDGADFPGFERLVEFLFAREPEEAR